MLRVKHTFCTFKPGSLKAKHEQYHYMPTALETQVTVTTNGGNTLSPKFQHTDVIVLL